jgi:hypothetical protein
VSGWCSVRTFASPCTRAAAAARAVADAVTRSRHRAGPLCIDTLVAALAGVVGGGVLAGDRDVVHNLASQRLRWWLGGRGAQFGGGGAQLLDFPGAVRARTQVGLELAAAEFIEGIEGVALRSECGYRGCSSVHS